MSTGRVSALILGISVFLGLSCLGYLLANAAIEYKQYERSVTVKGLSEREYQADVVIWPIQFSAADNDLKALYGTIENNIDSIREFLEKSGIAAEDISLMSPDITDNSANHYGSSSRPEFRYIALQTITIYSSHIEAVRSVMGNLSDLGREGIVFTGGHYGSQPEYLFTRLNDVKPEMIEEATRKAREVAEKFASDSQSKLG